MYRPYPPPTRPKYWHCMHDSWGKKKKKKKKERTIVVNIVWIRRRSDYIAPAIGPNKSKKLTRLIAPAHNIRGKVIFCEPMCALFQSNFAAYIVCRGYKPCEFLGFVWTDCWGNESYYVITSPANSEFWGQRVGELFFLFLFFKKAPKSTTFGCIFINTQSDKNWCIHNPIIFYLFFLYFTGLYRKIFPREHWKLSWDFQGELLGELYRLPRTLVQFLCSESIND